MEHLSRGIRDGEQTVQSRLELRAAQDVVDVRTKLGAVDGRNLSLQDGFSFAFGHDLIGAVILQLLDDGVCHQRCKPGLQREILKGGHRDLGDVAKVSRLLSAQGITCATGEQKAA